MARQWWRYAFDKLVEGSLSDRSVLQDLIKFQRQAQNALTRIKKADAALRYHSQIKELTKRDVSSMSMNEAKSTLSELADFLKDKNVSTVKGLTKLENEFFKSEEGKAIYKAANDKAKEEAKEKHKKFKPVNEHELYKDYQDFVNAAKSMGRYDARTGKYSGAFGELVYGAGAAGGSLFKIKNAMNVRNLNEVGEELYDMMYKWKMAGYPSDDESIRKYFK